MHAWEQQRVMIFNEQAFFYTLSPSTDYTWHKHKFRIANADTDYAKPEVEWSKSVRVSEHEWLYFMGAKQNP